MPREGAASWRVGRPRRGLESELDSDEHGLRLTVRSQGVELLHLAAEARGLLSGSVLTTPREAARLLAGSGELEGAHELVVPGDRALEPLEVVELRARVLTRSPPPPTASWTRPSAWSSGAPRAPRARAGAPEPGLVDQPAAVVLRRARASGVSPRSGPSARRG